MPVGGIGVTLIIIACGVLPYLAWRTARVLSAGDIGIPRRAMFLQVIALQAFIFAAGWAAARENEVAIFSMPQRPLVAWLAAAIALAVMVAALKVRWKSRENAQKLRLYSMLPHSRGEFALFVVVCVAAGIAEELAYRGVVPALLARITGNEVLAVLIAAIAFAIAHAVQGWRAVGSIFLIALGAQALVMYAGSLVPAMVMHAAYDLIAGVLVPRWFERDAASAGPSAGAAASDP